MDIERVRTWNGFIWVLLSTLMLKTLNYYRYFQKPPYLLQHVLFIISWLCIIFQSSSKFIWSEHFNIEIVNLLNFPLEIIKIVKSINRYFKKVLRAIKDSKQTTKVRTEIVLMQVLFVL